MGAFTVLSADDLAEIAGRFHLGAVLDSWPIAAGTINSNFAAITERGSFFIRVNEGKAEADVAWEAQLVSALAGHGLKTPMPRTVDGAGYVRWRDKLVSVFPWVDGEHRLKVSRTTAKALGAQLATLHGIQTALAPRVSIYDQDHLRRRYEGFAASTDPQLAGAIAILGEELAATTAGTIDAPRGIIHGDLFRDNVLWDDAGRLVALLDFEQASGGLFAYDLAVCINDWCWDEAPRLDLATALLAGYESVRTLTDADKAALPNEVRRAAMRFTITRITDVYLANVTNPDKDFRAFLARCEAWRGPALGQLRGLL